MASVKAAGQEVVGSRYLDTQVRWYFAVQSVESVVSRCDLGTFNFPCSTRCPWPAGLQPRFGAGSRRAKAWVSNELAVIDGVPRLVSGPSHRTCSLLALWWSY